MRSAGTRGKVHLFAYLHDSLCQPNHKKSTGEIMNFGSVNFQLKELRLMYVPADAAQNRWETDWMRRWFYHTSPSGDGLHSTGGPIDLIASPEIALTRKEEALLRLLLNTTRRLSTRDLVEKFCTFRIWPLA